MVGRRDITAAVTKLVRAGIVELDAGRGERDPAVVDPFGRPIEWVDISTSLWDHYCPDIPAPWRYPGGVEAEDLDAVWDVLGTAGAKFCHGRGIEMRYPKERDVVIGVLLQRPVQRGVRRSNESTCRSTQRRL